MDPKHPPMEALRGTPGRFTPDGPSVDLGRRARLGPKWAQHVCTTAQPPAMRPDQLERRLRKRPDALGPAPRAELLNVLMLPDFERADRIGEFWGYPESRDFAELLIDCEEDRVLGAVLVVAAWYSCSRRQSISAWRRSKAACCSAMACSRMAALAAASSALHCRHFLLASRPAMKASWPRGQNWRFLVISGPRTAVPRAKFLRRLRRLLSELSAGKTGLASRIRRS